MRMDQSVLPMTIMESYTWFTYLNTGPASGIMPANHKDLLSLESLYNNHTNSLKYVRLLAFYIQSTAKIGVTGCL